MPALLSASLALLLVLGIGCRSEPSVEGAVAVADGIDVDNVRVVAGHGWPSVAPAVAAPVGMDARFRVDARVGAVTAFWDVNENGQLDRHAEPSARCARTERGWRCPLSLSRLVAHRVQNGRITKGDAPIVEASLFADDVTVLVESYQANGRPDSSVEYCLEGDASSCARFGGSPFEVASGRAISPCALEGSLQSGRPIRVVRKRAQRVLDTKDLPYPPAMNLRVSVAEDGRQYVIRGRAELPVTHALVWVGAVDGSVVRWSSELEPSSLRVDGAAIEAVVDKRNIGDCASCKVMLQVAHVEETETTGVYSETRYFWQREAGT